jgi:hypothetical protein
MLYFEIKLCVRLYRFLLVYWFIDLAAGGFLIFPIAAHSRLALGSQLEKKVTKTYRCI